MEPNREAVRQRLKEGKFLEVTTGGGAFEVWAEPFGNPPSVFYEGERFPIEDLDRIVDRILADLATGQVRCRWVED